MQVIRLELVENVTKEILRSLKNNEMVRLRCGKKPVVQVGKKTVFLDSSVESFPSEVFSRSGPSSAPLYFSGRLSHTLEVQRAQEATAKSDEALTTLENTLKTIQEQRASNGASFVRTREEMKQVGKKDNRPSPLTGQASSLRKDRFLGSTPSSPFLGASFSPRQGPTSAPLPSSGGPTKDKVRLDAVKIPLLHLLAIRPMTTAAIAEKLRASKDDCERLLDKVARDGKDAVGKKELKDKSYRELDIWKFPYPSPADRQAAIDNAIHAYDRLRVEKTDALWQLLLPPEERGKGKVLSRLNFDKPIPSQASTPRPDHRSGEDVSESRVDASDREPSKGRAKKKESERSTLDISGPPKKAKDKGAATLKAAARPEAVGAQSKDKKGPQHNGKSTKQENKFKSAERIEDSDEEAEGATAVVVKPSSGMAMPSKVVKGVSTSPSKKQTPITHQHRPHLSGSSSGSGSDKPSRVTGNINKALRPESKGDNMGPSSTVSPRPRTGSSPQKPSPLGSSPPANSTDLDNSSSSKASTHSSAPSSPPSSTDMPQLKHGNKYSPVISNSRGRSPAKRKADRADDEPPSKRAQVNGVHLTGLSNGVADHLKRPALDRKTSESECSSSPEKPGPNREDIVDEAKRFQKYYKKYKDLYDKISQMDETERDDKEMGDLWRMHKRLKEMKSEIWHNWERVRAPEKGE